MRMIPAAGQSAAGARAPWCEDPGSRNGTGILMGLPGPASPAAAGSSDTDSRLQPPGVSPLVYEWAAQAAAANPYIADWLAWMEATTGC